MIQRKTIKQRRGKRVARIRAVVVGSKECPRLAIFRSHTHLYGQIFDDESHTTMGAATVKNTNKEAGKTLGKQIVALCTENKVKRLVFDRGGNKYHGVIAMIADTIREGGVTI